MDVNPVNSTYFMNVGVSRSELINRCQVSEKELDHLLQSDERFHLFTIEVLSVDGEQRYAYFQPELLYDLIDQLLVYLSNSSIKETTVQNVIDNNDGIINSKFLLNNVIVRYALHYIADYQVSNDTFIVSTFKIIKSIALTLLYTKCDYYLTEYIDTLKHAMDIYS